jgi:hypothetical protein
MDRACFQNRKRHDYRSVGTALELIQPVDKKAKYRVTQHLWIEVEILDTKMSYGRTLYLITPVAGCGNQWVTGDRLQIHD